MRTLSMLLPLLVKFGAPLPESASSSNPLPTVCVLSASERRTDSAVCMSCHDGSVAPEVGGFDVGSGRHPVDIDYESIAMRRPDAYTPAAWLPSSVMLRDGKLTCTTCHAAASTEPAHTSLTMERSRLCLACHVY